MKLIGPSLSPAVSLNHQPAEALATGGQAFLQASDILQKIDFKNATLVPAGFLH
jgi:hypothetical protein